MGANNSRDISKAELKAHKFDRHFEHIEKHGIECSDSEDVDDIRSDGADRQSIDSIDHAAMGINPNEMLYPFENLVMEGGGNKGLAYCGVIKCLEDLGMLGKIKRIGGTSAGAMSAVMLALGYTSEEMLSFLASDLERVFIDHSCGYFSLLPNLLRKFGWNPGNKIQEWFGNAIKEKTGSTDTTFFELYEQKGIELCVVVTNLNLMIAEYCHPKTTPNMPIKVALRMTMSIPGMFSAMKYNSRGQENLFVDGGVLMNYPINCFDGWFLSLKKEDSFLLKLKPLKELPNIMSSKSRFKPTGPNKTMGLLLFDQNEKEVMRFGLEERVGAVLPEQPRVKTKLFLKKELHQKTKLKFERDHQKIVKAVDSFFQVLQDHNVHDQNVISKDELKAALDDSNFSKQHKEILFGKVSDLEAIFDILDANNNNQISFRELMQFVEERGLRMQARFLGYKRRDVNSFKKFLTALSDTMFLNLKFVSVKRADEDRTVGINTGHVETNDYELEDEDRDFMVERGYNATMSFLRYYAANHPSEVKKREHPMSNGHATQHPNNIEHHHDNNDTASDKDVLLK